MAPTFTLPPSPLTTPVEFPVTTTTASIQGLKFSKKGFSKRKLIPVTMISTGSEVNVPLGLDRRKRIIVPLRLESPSGVVYAAEVAFAMSSHSLHMLVMLALLLHI